ncbi:MAG: hypothetical protein ACI9FJ_001528 [Alteromonadaceae bacterium]|jgi:hypothetical protein
MRSFQLNSQTIRLKKPRKLSQTRFPSALALFSDKRLAIFYSKALEQTESKITSHGGTIIKALFDFPGGRRFHFIDSNGNEYVVWTDRKALK